MRCVNSVVLIVLVSLTACNLEGNSTQLEAAQAVVGTITEIPDFAAIKDIKTRKKAFFDFLRPIVISENAKVAKSRVRMLDIATILDNGEAVPPKDEQWLRQLADKYHIEMAALDDEQAWLLLKRRVDTIPFRLALAQAANESNWGTSRFAREGRNLFGEWCFTEGCGMVPQRRRTGMTHEVAVFSSVNESVASYLYHLNRVDIYMPLRVARHKDRTWGRKPTADSLAAGLSGYSERGKNYVEDIRKMIRVNYDLMAGKSPA
ncbi:MAG: hypothetical protein COS82_10565 [Zetaproteobacteria bacterium CG06_land_8_20_14_3_00_59_53]|nr:MAG: hypothetical protein COX56_08890 [Zetaproteobacteria bacterium CG23_combo_of_CG06-09_8_20_14_all_59_86]PIQ64041.1 MAG: hypothetical protein COV97_11305 [Zetaproteobacteria bacterium CG11_big_fil_rev_8_21_14_0_20_59_439]PIU69603.1 MAG: hypothetical protein COS82_10565 [Zetaproteobacteria bacterium CG06_land_8_20_14_3_00_59_53]PIU96257.1 MAG: hypothetical protein COS62_09810 [Zetaproteobacteria bacterium CG03_land_8_20_14_0_80_59_51]PIY44831.1 MAG: hypothetical protein COZ02_11395 [Zetapr